MKDFVTFLNIINNLKNVPRHGPILFAGIKGDNIPEHSFMVSIIVASLLDDFRNEGHEINGERILKVALTHDISDGILGDIPTSSPSYRSFFEEDIKGIFEKAQKKALTELMNLIDNRGLFEKEEDLTELEHDLLKIADIVALMTEIIDMKFKYRYEWIGKFWNATIKRLDDYSKYTFVETLKKELEKVYESEEKPANPLLTQKKFN